MLHIARAQGLRAYLILPLLLASSLAAQAQDDADIELGRQIFLELAEPPCSICHRLADAEATGTIAPNLDALQPTAEEVKEAMMTGPGVMPAYAETLTQEEMDTVAEYVAAVAGSP